MVAGAADAAAAVKSAAAAAAAGDAGGAAAAAIAALKAATTASAAATTAGAIRSNDLALCFAFPLAHLCSSFQLHRHIMRPFSLSLVLARLLVIVVTQVGCTGSSLREL